MVRIPLAIVVLLALVLAACSGDDSTGGSAFEETACSGIRIPSGQGEQARCGWVTVPVDHGDPSRGQLRLRVVVLENTGPAYAPDPLIYLSGGPGASALEADLQLWTADTAAPIQRERDLVFFDQRGTGASGGLECPEVTEAQRRLLGQRIGREREANTVLDALGECRERLEREAPLALQFVTSAQSARDVDAIARALGYRRYNLYGVSYGTRLALTVMRDLPGSVRSAVLDSVYPPNADAVVDAPASNARGLEAVLAACEMDERCARAYPRLREDLARAVERLNAEPVEVRTPQLPGLPGTDVLVTGERFLAMLMQALYVSPLIPQLPAHITSVAAGRDTSLRVLATLPVAVLGAADYGAYFSIQCAEEVPFARESDYDEAIGRLPPLYRDAFAPNAEEFGACARWDVPAATDPAENEPVRSDIPVLMLAGAFDPITPPAYARLAAQTLPNAVVLEFPAAGHAILGDECAMEAVASFLARPRRPDTSCIDALEPPRWLAR